MDMPTSPGLGTLFETPVAPRSARERLNVVDDTPIRSRLPLGLAGDGWNRSGAVTNAKGKEKERFVSGGGSSSSDGAVENGGAKGGENGGGMSIYQQLGWDTTDLDDIDDLL
jgi:DNA replication regulator SLD3